MFALICIKLIIFHYFYQFEYGFWHILIIVVQKDDLYNVVERVLHI